MNEDDAMNIKMLGISVPGTPGEDYPILATVPKTSFTCADKDGGGYYADMETQCQVHHTCGNREDLSLITYSQLCPNGTIFDQEGQTCRWWYLVDCQASENFYYSENNIRGSEVSTFNIDDRGDQETDYQYTENGGNRNNNVQFGQEQEVVYIPIPASVLRGQTNTNSRNNPVSRTTSVIRTQQGNSRRNNGGRRTNQRTQNNRVQSQGGSDRRQSNNNNVGTNTFAGNRNRPNTLDSGRNRQSDRRTQPIQNNIDEDYDYNDANNIADNGISPRGPVTLPPSKRKGLDFSFQQGRFKFSNNG